MMSPSLRCVVRGMAGLLLGLLAGCNASNAQSDEAKSATPRPEPKQVLESLHASYVSPAGVRQECLGRLVFDVPRDMEWGLSPPGSFSGDRYRFTETMHGGHDDLWVGNVQVIVLEPAAWKHVQSMARDMEADKNIAIREYQTKVETKKRRIKNISAAITDPNRDFSDEERLRGREGVEEIKKEITDIESNIEGIKKDWHPLDLGIPNSLGYAGGPDLYAFVLREGRAYKFVSASGEGQPPFEERQRKFLDMLKRFQFRKMYEIPKEPGICVPYGFIPDDGRLSFRIGVSLRYADRPGVIYTLRTGVVLEDGVLDSEPSGLKALARAGGAGIGGVLGGGRNIKTIGPRSAKIGALSAQQGGISMNVADPGKPPVTSYSVYTGYGGWGHSRVLPYITVDMRSFTKEQEPTVKVDPPPLDESLGRLDTLLKSIRLRPTDPVMPELLEAGYRRPGR